MFSGAIYWRGLSEGRLETFEDIARLLHLNAVEKLIIAKRCIKNKAKLLLVSGQKILSNDKFKEVKLNKFGANGNAAKIHE